MLGMSAKVDMPSLPGDFYSDVDSVTRGLSLPIVMMDSGFESPNWGSKSLKDANVISTVDGNQSHLVSLDGRARSTPVAKEPSRTHFCGSQTREALPIPDDKIYRLEASTFMVRSQSAAQLGNRVIDFLEADAAGLITKVNHEKYTIKAEIFVDGSFCEVKVRVYNVSIGQYAVEMQRQSGDGIAFFPCLSSGFAAAERG